MKTERKITKMWASVGKIVSKKHTCKKYRKSEGV